MIEGVSVRLRPWRDDDLQTITALRNDIALQAQLLARARGSNESQVRLWLQSRSTSTDSLLFIIADALTDATLGFLQLTGIDAVDQRAEVGICLADQAQGRGMGRESLSLLLPYVRDSWGMRKLSLRVRSDNLGAIRCYQHVGFVQCGLLYEHVYFDNAWRDVVLMEIFLHNLRS